MTTEEAIELRDSIQSEFSYNNTHHIGCRVQAETLIVLTEIRELLANQGTEWGSE